jgi:hypothetical protein
MEAPMLEVKPATAVGDESGPANDEDRFREADLYALLLLAALVFITIFPWHAVNQRLPIWDGADFVLTSQKIAHSFHDGVLAGVRALYLERGWRPIAFPNLAAPFFILSGGQIRLSVGLTQFAFALLMAAYIYCFLRQESSRQSALTGSLLIVGAPWLVNFSQLFYSEVLWLAATSGVVYHLSIALRRSSRFHHVLAGVWLGMMGAARPIETAVLSFVPIMTLLAYAVRRNTVRVADVAAFAVQMLTVSIAIALLANPEGHEYVASVLLVVSALIIGLSVRACWVHSPLLAALVSAELTASTWHLPTIRSLYLWVYETSFGTWAQVTDQRFKGVSPLVILGELLDAYSADLLLIIAVLAVPAGFAIFRSQRNAKQSHAIALIGFAALMIAPMLILYSLSGTSDSRRVMPAVLIVYIGLSALALMPRGPLPRTRLACLTAIAVALLTVAAANGLDIKSNALLKIQGQFGYLRNPDVGQDPNGPVLDGLLKMGITSGNVSAYTRCYRGHDDCERSNLPAFEPMALSTLARERDIPLYVHYVTDLDFSKPESLSRQILIRDFQYVLVDMAELQQPVNEADPYARHTEEFIAMERSDLPHGLIKRGCFSTLNRPMCVVEVDQHTY